MKLTVKIKMFGLITLFAILLISCNNTSNNAENTNIDTLKSVINAPLPKLDINYSAYTVHPQRDTVLTFKTGSKIKIPKNAFLDSEGNIVKSKVDIKYREFSNAFDIYLGGIPMQYDSAGINTVFETAGMIEINASSNNKPLYANPQNKIQVDMNSYQQGSQYNLYQLDTLTGQWSNIGKDSIKQTTYKKELSKLPVIPEPPKKVSSFSFTINNMIRQQPELAKYKDVIFEPAKKFTWGSLNASSLKIKKKNYGTYQITFIQDDGWGNKRKQKYTCYLAFQEGKDYDNAMKKFQKKYGSLIAKRKKMKEKIEAEWIEYYKIKKLYADAGMLDYFQKEEIKSMEGEKKILRRLEISNFGCINCDYPSSYPQGAELTVQFEDKQNNKIKLTNIVLIVKGRNALFRYKDKIKFNPSKENLLWGITGNGKLAYFNSDDFKSVNSTSGNYTFVMTIHEKELKTYEDIVSVLFSVSL